MSYQTEISALKAALPSLSARDADFAASLLAQAARKGLSDKQMVWVRKLATPAAPAVQGADLSPIHALFDRAFSTGAKRPTIRFATADDVAFRLTVAGSQSCKPGAINVTSAEASDTEGRTWFGRILKSGQFEGTRKASIDAAPVRAALECFAADPAGQAAAYGQRTGDCCFCSKTLTDARSVKVGYGPHCARKFGLPH
jgi:hypothetical protein